MDMTTNYLLPDHKLIKKISHTGMSSVYLAESLKNKNQVIIKILDFDPNDESDAKAIKRFDQEYQLLNHLDHPNIASIKARYTDNNYACIVMEYFPNGDLSHQILEGLDKEQAINYLRQMAFALEAIHSRNIVHRDIKPRNILFREDNTLVISDFGIARVTEQSYGLTLQGMILGSPYYMSPEQIDDEVLDPRSDLYSLGAVFYEMLTGKKPFRGNSLMKIFYAHINDPIPSLPVLLQEYQPIIDRLLAKRPQDRFDSATDLLNALKQIKIEHEKTIELMLA